MSRGLGCLPAPKKALILMNTENILTKAYQKFGVLKRTCHSGTHTFRRRVLYLALDRSQFEHCLPVWQPCSSTLMNKVFQKNSLSGFSLNKNYPTQ